MKKTTTNTNTLNDTNIKKQEGNEMKKEFIEIVDRYYAESCYEAEELVISLSTIDKCRELVAYSDGPEDRRDKTAAEIHKELVEYLQTLPEEHFEEILTDFHGGLDELVDIIYDEYIAAPFDIDYDIEE